jgi:hypothetical protein
MPETQAAVVGPLIKVGRRSQYRTATEASASASHAGRASADGSAGVANGGSCHAHTVNPCPARAAIGGFLDVNSNFANVAKSRKAK